MNSNDRMQQQSSNGSVDAEYRFGRPTVYLKPIEIARLTLLRSALGETQAERQASAAGLRKAA